MASADYPYASQLRMELGLRNRRYARGRAHVESYGNPPVIVYAPEHPTDEDLSLGTPPEYPTAEDLSDRFPVRGGRHGNFLDRAYAAMAARPEWMRRFGKVHPQGARSLPKPRLEPARRWRELDSSMSSDALLMNVFCTPGVVESAAVRSMLGVDECEAPVFGWRARVPLHKGRFDRTEVDMRLGGLLVESKLTESDFQTCKAAVVESYRDFDEVFEAERLPRVLLPAGRRREAAEFPEDYSQEGESLVDLTDATSARRSCPPPVGLLLAADKVDAGYAGYQLVRNVLAAHARACSFCVIHDERRPDLREAWFEVMAAVKPAALRVRLKVLTWQELAALLPEDLQDFLDLKYGIVKPGRVASPVEGPVDSR